MNITEQLIERLKQMRDQIRYYGLILGGIFIFIDLLQFLQHNNITIIVGFLFVVLKITLLFVGASQIVKRIKKEFFTTGMTYSQSFSLIMRLFIYASLLVGIFNFVLNSWIAPDYMTETVNNTVEFIRNHIDGGNMLSVQKEYFEDFIEKIEEAPIATPLEAMWSQMWSYVCWGVFVSIILSFHFRDKDINPLSVVGQEDNRTN